MDIFKAEPVSEAGSAGNLVVAIFSLHNPGSVVVCHHIHTLPASHISKHIPKHFVEQGSVLC